MAAVYMVVRYHSVTVISARNAWPVQPCGCESFRAVRADSFEREALKGGLMEESCCICGVCEAGKGESGVQYCVCKGYVRYVVWGVLPTPMRD